MGVIWDSAQNAQTKNTKQNKFRIWEGFTMSPLMLSVVSFIAGVKDRFSSEKGATATEYSLLIAFVAFAIIAGAMFFGGALSDWFVELGVEIGGWTTEPVEAPAPAA